MILTDKYTDTENDQEFENLQFLPESRNIGVVIVSHHGPVLILDLLTTHSFSFFFGLLVREQKGKIKFLNRSGNFPSETFYHLTT